MAAPSTGRAAPLWQNHPRPMATAELVSFVQAVRRKAADALGVMPDARRDVLAAMLQKPADDRALYWLQLLLSMGIATFGLVLDSSGVVIGAMLVAPLMTPIVELSMALVVMSAYLLVQALARVLVSVIVVSLGAALITLVLPFQEATGEILARTSPTVLDLFVAIFCALAAATVVARPHSGATSTAAGTAIGISLVPPLCAAGFGLGSGSGAIAEGAFLLFTANFCAILVFSAVFFWLVGFRPVKEGSSAERQPDGPVSAVKLWLARLIEARLGGRHGAYIRILVPMLLLGVVIVPLARALSEVSREVRARTALSRLVGSEPLLADALHVEQRVDRGDLQLRVVVVGTDEQAAELERRLSIELASVTGARPLVSVRAVPQASVFNRTRSTAEARQPAPIDLVSPREAADKVASQLGGSLERHLPAAAGRLLDSRTEIAHDGALAVTIALAGNPLEPAATAILAGVLSSDVGTAVRLTSVGLPVEAVTAAASEHDTWHAAVAEPLLVARGFPALSLCVAVPADTQLRRLPAAARTRDTIRTWLAGVPAERLDLQTGTSWSLRVASGPCASERAPQAATAPAAPTGNAR